MNRTNKILRTSFDVVLVAALLFYGGRVVLAWIPRPEPTIANPGRYLMGPMIFGDPKEDAFSLAVWSDYECPFCERLALQLDSLAGLHPGAMRVVYHHLLSPTHLAAEDLGVAAECAGRVGAFGRVHLRLFALGRQHLSSSEIVDSVLPYIAPDNAQEYVRCTADPEVRRSVRESSDSASALGLSATPTLLLAGRLVTGAPGSAAQLWDSVSSLRATR